jgi:hypothetical protein
MFASVTDQKERESWLFCPPFVSIPHVDIRWWPEHLNIRDNVYNIQDGKILISNVSFLYCLLEEKYLKKYS